MKTAVVTGANGFIGKAVTLKLLEEGYSVFAVVTDAKGLSDIHDPRLVIVQAFFQDYPDLPNKISAPIDLFFHFAWQGVWGPAFQDYGLQMSNAVNAGKAMEVAQKLRAKKFILASTVNVLETKKKLLDSHVSGLRATTNYAMAKISAEMICRTLAAKGQTDFNCAYIAMAYGPNNFSLMVPNVVIAKLNAGISPDLVAGNGLYDLIYIDDIARGFFAIGEKGHPMTSYYLGHSHLKTFKALFSDVGRIVNPEVKLNFGAYPDDNSLDYSMIDLNGLKNDTGFEPSANFEDSIKTTSRFIQQSSFDFLGGKKA